MTDYWQEVNRGPHPDESGSWVEGDVLEFGGGGVSDDYTCRLRFVRLDPDDPIGFVASEWRVNEWSEPCRGWTRGRFVRVVHDAARAK